MKKQFLILAFGSLAACCSSLTGEEVTMTEVRRLGFLPQDKTDYRPEDKMEMKRRNPFADRAKKTEPKAEVDNTETEESKIRAFLQKEKISGIVKLGDKYIATLGRLVFEAGQTLPPLIPGQTQILRVMRVDKTTVELGWVEDSPYDTATPRKITLKVDLTPRVEVLLASNDSDPKDGAKGTYLLDDTGKLFIPRRNDLTADPSEIADNLPPSVDVNRNSALSADEQAQMLSNESPPEDTPPPVPTGGESPAPIEDPEQQAPSPTPLPPPDEATPGELPMEDAVQPDPDTTAPPAPPEGAP